jgi:hypothetical protein
MSAVARLENHRAEKSGNLAIFYPLLALSLSNSCPGMPISVCFLSSPLRLIIAFGVVTNSCISESPDISRQARTFFRQIIVI